MDSSPWQKACDLYSRTIRFLVSAHGINYSEVSHGFYQSDQKDTRIVIWKNPWMFTYEFFKMHHKQAQSHLNGK
jgi:hypothetical protein